MLNSEKRILKRRHLIYYLRVFDRVTGQLLGHLVDITPEGVMLISEQPLATDATYALKLDLPADTFGKETVEFEARALWSRPDVNPSFHDTGFQMLTVAEADERVIRRLITEYGFHD